MVGGVRYRYIETSALLAVRLENDASAREAIRGEGIRFVSALTLAEAGRRIVRTGVVGHLAEPQVRASQVWLWRFGRRCQVMAITDDILARVRRRFPIEPIRTLDAIHLATIESIGEDPVQVAVVTRDRRIADNARALGYLVE
jgi:predicted nucleic acid-binding protein